MTILNLNNNHKETGPGLAFRPSRYHFLYVNVPPCMLVYSRALIARLHALISRYFERPVTVDIFQTAEGDVPKDQGCIIPLSLIERS